ncbi:MAG: hypothetical protein A3H72_00875 [Candidatus Doudnabacteria bacterium RIFCSPLOWO2_02_FULL_48_8]|uniref:Ada DNA repair metal-binding domain-containing protein n=1 Tax=Candidatus Doudnabacteria bacterium RIFCSPHIGHO2_01_FULL_46_24 TaxID=1817825 RepID=A0A1F5NTX8_9BACT|nr:MAG: hypothetical protein A2720_01090 [Candidatus Doudnabacteria bacterium RIFCSPHIGHO2_01_FULL_46_24]OGE95186.1 MAG: hypothetical protein A3H72_00875 [Candidatus Doudnabacteria bacterium RIFCSPLOWO2_02_FULL_48_8]OGE96106.1 MAG: hypothetical protein A3E98_02570 [Candidatus Doudnabacteria bacterium RIFCSPHIGHO2_12_FULL_48_11]
MHKFKEFVKNHQLKIALSIGYLLVASLAFGLGRLTAFKYDAPEINIEQAFSAPTNYSGSVAGIQTETTSSTSPTADDCPGKIKGNISSTGKIYHMPGGAFYNRTNPEICFTTESEAQAAGFRRSSR